MWKIIFFLILLLIIPMILGLITTDLAAWITIMILLIGVCMFALDELEKI